MKSTLAESKLARINRWIWGLHLLAVGVTGLALFPMIFFFYSVWRALAGGAVWLKILLFSFSISFGFFLFGFTLILLCVFFKNLFGFRVTPGLHSMRSEEALSWMAYNSLVLIANGAFLDVFRISPFQIFFYRLMGARVGRDVRVNTGGLADLALLDIGDNAVVGGGVALIAHAFERSFLRLEPVKIGKNVTIGLGSVIMPGCEIGDGASVAPCSFLARGTKVPPRGVWGGNPVRDLRAERRLQE